MQYSQESIFRTQLNLVANPHQTHRYGASALAIAANSGSHLSPFANNFSLLYNNSSLVSVAYSAFGLSTIASTGQLS